MREYEDGSEVRVDGGRRLLWTSETALRKPLFEKKSGTS
jgi:hypothetical protein